jgi:hypothetical protein
MSKLVEKLQRLNKPSGPPIGFQKKSKDEATSPIAIVASLAIKDLKGKKGTGSTGFDAAVINNAGLDDAMFEQVKNAVGDIPSGISMSGAGKDDVTKLTGDTWDFIVFDVTAPIAHLENVNVGKILTIDSSLEPGLVRTINDLQTLVDAVLVTGDEQTLTIERVLTLQRAADLLAKPILVSVNSSITASELAVLDQVGVRGIVLPEGTSQKAFTDLQKMLHNLPKKSAGEAKGVKAILPRVNSAEPEVDDDEDEEDY